jgi:hypothetical protein
MCGGQYKVIYSGFNCRYPPCDIRHSPKRSTIIATSRVALSLNPLFTSRSQFCEVEVEFFRPCRYYALVTGRFGLSFASTRTFKWPSLSTRYRVLQITMTFDGNLYLAVDYLDIDAINLVKFPNARDAGLTCSFETKQEFLTQRRSPHPCFPPPKRTVSYDSVSKI